MQNKNKNKNKIKAELTILFSLFALSILITSALPALPVFAQTQTSTTTTTTITTMTNTTTTTARRGLVVKPAQLGTYRVTIPMFSDYVATQSFIIGNAYDVPMNVTLKMSGNVSQVAQLAEASFLLQPNETKTVYYALTVKEPGIYTGGAVVVASVLGRTTFVGYQADLNVLALKSQVPEAAVYVVAGVAALAVAGFGLRKISSKRHGKRLKFLFTMSLFFVLSAGFAASAHAAEIAMVVKNANSLDLTHEKRIYDILSEMGHDVTLVDKNIGINYNTYDMIVIAGRPFGGGQLDSFVANIPVNEVPTIAIDYYYLDDWGWVKPPGASSLSSSDRHKVYIQAVNPITNGYSLGQKVYIHLIDGYTIVDMVKSNTNMTTVATADVDAGLPIITYANPNTQLANGKKVGNHAAVIFFGATYPNLWTEDAVRLFKNSVNWLVSLDFVPPTTPQLATPDSGFDRDGTVTWQWTASNSSSGILNYEFELSSSPQFTTLFYSSLTGNLNITTTGLIDAQTYYARVRAWDSVNIHSEWSNVAQVTIDTSNLIVKINSPASDSTISAGSSVLINATIAAPNRMPPVNGTCNVTIANAFAGTVPFNKTINTCSGSVTAPSIAFTGPSLLSVIPKNTLGNTNSSSIPIYYQGPASSSGSGSSSSFGGGSSDFGGNMNSALLFVQVPTQFTAHENSDLTFAVIVKNDGLVDVQAVKVNVEKMDFATPAVEPALVDDLPARASQNFTVTLHFPEGSQGNYPFRVKILAYGASITKRVTVDVLPEIMEPRLSIADVQLPERFLAGQETTVNVTLANDGNMVAEASVNIAFPAGWSMREEEQDQPIVVDEGSQQDLLFHVTPSEENGHLDFIVSYFANEQDRSFTQSYDVNVTEPVAAALTGLFAFVQSPEFFIPTLLGIGVLLALYFGTGGLKETKHIRPTLTGLKKLGSLNYLSDSLKSMGNSLGRSASGLISLLSPSHESFRYVWPRGNKGYLFNYLFGAGAGAAAGAAAGGAAAASTRAARSPRQIQARATVKDAMFDKWEARYHPGVHARTHGARSGHRKT